jgi:hypothetical protein
MNLEEEEINAIAYVLDEKIGEKIFSVPFYSRYRSVLPYIHSDRGDQLYLNHHILKLR